MKKFTSKLLLLMTVLAMAFSLAACGIKKNDSESADRKENTAKQEGQSEKEENSQDKDEDKAESGDEDKTQSNDKDKKGSTLYGSVADYVNSDEIQSALSSLKSSLQEGMSIDIVAEGDNKLVYIFTYQTIEHKEGDGMAEALESAIASQDTVFQQTANSVKPFVSNDQVIVEIRYVDMNGAVIFSRTYVSGEEIEPTTVESVIEIPKVGMTADEVKKTKWGEPDKINKDTYAWGSKEQWVYNSNGYVYFENGIVTSVSER